MTEISAHELALLECEPVLVGHSIVVFVHQFNQAASYLLPKLNKVHSQIVGLRFAARIRPEHRRQTKAAAARQLKVAHTGNVHYLKGILLAYLHIDFKHVQKLAHIQNSVYQKPICISLYFKVLEKTVGLKQLQHLVDNIEFKRAVDWSWTAHFRSERKKRNTAENLRNIGKTVE
ncbi:hypothetical protein AYI70_g1288 [Smittium culicis]|uniref:Uncharacterized protein n=1 Tax=Smittium culicis TaxID=133412 RepID=A0A1R1YDC6_9FUNG|nr:hypothetical protein AYI70_g1288 [Smittium culicis]